jgi:hypothetical protein
LTKPGDIVCVLAAAETPFVLQQAGRREISDELGEKDVNDLVGECYIHGIMKGEAIQDARGWQDVVI